MLTRKTLIYIAFSSLLFQQCKSTQRAKSLRIDYEYTYIEQFKLTYLRQLLTKCYNNSPAIQEILKSDNSGFTEPILTQDDYRLIDSLATADNRAMQLDSAEGMKRAEGSQGKRPLQYILRKLENNRLDNLARQRLKLSGVKTWEY